MHRDSNTHGQLCAFCRGTDEAGEQENKCLTTNRKTTMEENNNLTAERSLEIITAQIERSRRSLCYRSLCLAHSRYGFSSALRLGACVSYSYRTLHQKKQAKGARQYHKHHGE